MTVIRYGFYYVHPQVLPPRSDILFTSRFTFLGIGSSFLTTLFPRCAKVAQNVKLSGNGSLCTGHI